MDLEVPTLRSGPRGMLSAGTANHTVHKHAKTCKHLPFMAVLNHWFWNMGVRIQDKTSKCGQ